MNNFTSSVKYLINKIQLSTLLVAFSVLSYTVINAQSPAPSCNIISSSDCSNTLTACVNSQIPYTASVAFSFGATYTWDFTVNTSGASILVGQGTLYPVVHVGNNAGQYVLRLTIVSATGTATCTASLTVLKLNSNASFTPATCVLPLSTITVTTTGGVGPYTYSITPGNIVNSSGIFSGLAPGSYNINTSDGPLSCPSVITVVIPEPPCNVNPGYTGCGYKFWRTHYSDWDQLNDYLVTQMPVNLKFISSTNFSEYFNIPPSSAGLPANVTMGEILFLNGGNGCRHFAKYAVSALLTIASGQAVFYPTGTTNFTGVYNAIRAALLTANCNGVLRTQLKKVKSDCSGNNENEELRSPDFSEMNSIQHKISDINVTVTPFPNPYSEDIRFTIASEVSGIAVLELYTLTGIKITDLYKGIINAKADKIITYKSAGIALQTLIYKLTLNNKIVSGKVLYLN